MDRSSNSNKSLYEFIAVVVTVVLKFVFMDYLELRLLFIIVVMSCWACYIIYTMKTDRFRLKDWGLRLDNFHVAVGIILPFAIVAVISSFAIGYLRQTINLSWHIFPVLLMYPLWGILQQFLLISLIVGNLNEFSWNHKANVLFAALLFGGIHFPYVWLMLGTFILALMYGYVFNKARNVIVLGVFHGWLGGLFFYTVVNRDPLIEVFGKYFQ